MSNGRGVAAFGLRLPGRPHQSSAGVRVTREEMGHLGVFGVPDLPSLVSMVAWTPSVSAGPALPPPPLGASVPLHPAPAWGWADWGGGTHRAPLRLRSQALE